MASWLDILSQNYGGSQRGFNPFALIRGFSPQGRQELDQNQQIQSLGRQEAIQGAQGRIDARQFMASEPNAMTATPKSPEEMQVLQALTQLAQSRGAVTQQGVNTQIGQQNLGLAQQMQPHQVEGARLANEQAKQGLAEHKATQGTRQGILQNQQDLGRQQYFNNERNAALQQRLGEQQLQLNPAVMSYLQAAGLYGGATPRLNETYAPFIPGLPQGGGQPDDGGMGNALRDSINAANGKDGYKLSPPSGMRVGPSGNTPISQAPSAPSMPYYPPQLKSHEQDNASALQVNPQIIDFIRQLILQSTFAGQQPR